MSQSDYVPPPKPENEEERLDELYDLDLLDTAAELRFDRYTHLVAEVFDFPVVLVTLLDRDREWFKSKFGWSQQEVSRELSFCSHTINQSGVFVVPDTRAEPCLANNPLVTGDPYIRFYAGAVVHGPKGFPLGALCVVDYRPRQFDTQQRDWLRQFADLVEDEIRHAYDLEAVRASVEFSAYYDPITQLPNQRLLMDRLNKLIEWASQDPQSRVAVLLFNISGLRLLNQTLGSDAGDSLLRQLSQRLCDCCPPGGSVARLQGDDFVVTFPVFHPGDGSFDTTVKRLRASLRKPFRYGDEEHYLQLKVGGTLFPTQGKTAETLLEQASAAIRFNGENEPDAVRYFSQEESDAVAERLRMESCLRGALKENEFRMVYQPIVSLDDGKMIGLEALLRWDSKVLGPVSPEDFIPIAEDTGLILAIDRWVQSTVCKQLRQWQSDPSWRLPVAINVSAADLAQPTFAQDLLECMRASEVPGWLLWVEVTETSLLGTSETANRNLDLLRDASIHINIDDFGTGYSSLSYLRRLPLTSLKIDRSFIERLPASADEVALTQSIITMAQTLGLSQVAEGVETSEQLEFLQDNQCLYGQGYLFSRPLGPEQVPALRRQPLIY